MSVLVLLTLGALTVLNYRTCGDFRYPPVLMSGVWLIAMTVYYVSPLKIDAIGVLTVLIFISTITAFSGGGYLALGLSERGHGVRFPGSTPVVSISNRPHLKTLLLALSVAMLPLMIERAFQLALESGYDNFLIGLRTELLAENSRGYGYLNYGVTLSFFCTFLYAIELRSGFAETVKFYLSLVISLAYAVLGTGRTTVFFILAALAGIALMRERFSFKKFVITAFVFLTFFGFFAVVTGKGGNSDASWSDNVRSVGESLLMYGVGPLPAFDQVVRADWPLKYGKNMLIGPLNTFGGLAGMARVSRLREEVHVPFPSNVYTGLNAPYQDFGIVGVIVVFLVIGAASTYFYLRGLAGDPLYIFCYAVALYPLLLVTFSDEYFDPMNEWIKYGLCAYLYFRIWQAPQSKSSLA